MKRQKLFLSIFLAIIPVILIVISLKTINSHQKTWYAGNYDPSYAYLFNSLNINNLIAPGHIDHPGTTMQVIGGVILKAAWLINPYGGENLTEAVIAEPEHYLKILNSTVAILGALAIMLFGLIIYRKTNNIWYTLLFQLTPFVSGIILYNGFTRISQESTLMIASLSIAVTSLIWFFKQESRSSHKYWLTFGIISGFGIASKIIFIPLMLIPLLLVQRIKHKLLFILTAIISFFVFTIPIIVRYGYMADWFINLFSHSGIYGSGEASVIDTSAYIPALKELLTGEPLYTAIFIITTLFMIGSLIWCISKKASLMRSGIIVIVAIWLVQVLGFIITAKHPKLSYLLPYECLTGASIIIMLYIIFKAISNLRYKFIITGILAIALIFFGIRHGISEKEKLYSTDKNSLYEQAWRVALSRGNAVIAVSPGPTLTAALYFGNAYAANKYIDNLNEIYPHQYTFDSYNNAIVNWHRENFQLNQLLEKYDYNITVMGWDINYFDQLVKSNDQIKMERITFDQIQVGVITRK